MSNALVKAAGNKGLAALMDEAGAAFGAAASELNVNIGGLLSFSGNTGEFKYKGQIIDHGTVVAVYPERMRKGWVCWKGGKPIEKHVVNILGGERAKTQEELPDYGPYENETDGWSAVVELPLKILESQEIIDLSLSSKGGVGSLLRLGAEWSAKSKMNLDENGERKIMYVELGADGFKSPKSPGLKYAPTFKLTEWVTKAEEDEAAGIIDADADYVGDDQIEDAEVVEIEKTKPAAAAKPAVAKPAPPAANRPGFRPGVRGSRV